VRLIITERSFAIKRTYNAVGAWLENRGTAPDKVAASTELQSQLKLQNEVAQALMNEGYRRGALNIETIEVSPIVSDGKVSDLVKQEENRATELIEDFMIAANEVVARMLDASKSEQLPLQDLRKAWNFEPRRAGALLPQERTSIHTADAIVDRYIKSPGSILQKFWNDAHSRTALAATVFSNSPL
jgi:RNB domain-containing protein